jgi:hypothetical protein
MVGSDSAVLSYSVADLQRFDAGPDPTCYFDAYSVQQASSLFDEIDMFVINI